MYDGTWLVCRAYTHEMKKTCLLILLRDHPDNNDSNDKLCKAPYCCHNTHFTLVHSLTPFFSYEEKLVLHIQTVYFIHAFILCMLSAHNYLGVTQTEADFFLDFFSSQTEFMTAFVNQN